MVPGLASSSSMEVCQWVKMYVEPSAGCVYYDMAGGVSTAVVVDAAPGARSRPCCH